MENVMDRSRIAPCFLDDKHRPAYHFLPPANWMNDPVGLIQWDQSFHLFYQHNPNHPWWGDMHWGHAASQDMVYWKHLPVALAPTPGGPDQSGCWSGSVINYRGQPALIYTGRDGEHESVCLATSDEQLINWQKDSVNPVLEGPPSAYQTTAFRDPYVWRNGQAYYMAVGSGIVDRGGAVWLYRSRNLRHWEFLGPLFEAKTMEYGHTWECPSFFRLGKKYVLVVSVMADPGYVRYFIGDFRNYRFYPEYTAVFDNERQSDEQLALIQGDCAYRGGYFYAPQVFFVHRQGQRSASPVMFGWIWEGRGDKASHAAGWAGVQSLPRQLTLTSLGKLEVAPAPELLKLRTEYIGFGKISLERNQTYVLPMQGNCLELETQILVDNGYCGIKFYCAPDGSEETVLMYDCSAKRLILDRRLSSLSEDVHKTLQCASLELSKNEPLSLRIFLDRSVIEVYANQRVCLTTRVYPSREDSLGLCLFSGRQMARWQYLNIWKMKSIYS